MKMYSSREAAKKLGLSIATISTYIVQGKIPAPKAVTTGGITVHLWSEEDIERVRQLLPKIKNGRKTRYQKQLPVASGQLPVKGKSKKGPSRKKK